MTEDARPDYKRRLKAPVYVPGDIEKDGVVCTLGDTEIRACLFPKSRECEECTIYKWHLEGHEDAYERFLNVMRQLWD